MYLSYLHLRRKTLIVNKKKCSLSSLYTCVVYSCIFVKDPVSTEAQSVQNNLLQYTRDLRSVRRQKRNEMASEYALLKLILK